METKLFLRIYHNKDYYILKVRIAKNSVLRVSSCKFNFDYCFIIIYLINFVHFIFLF